MTDDAPTMHAVVTAALASAIGVVPGCRMKPQVRSLGPAALGIAKFEIEVQGRSPSLHGADMKWRLETSVDVANPQQALIQIESALSTQRTRADASILLGHAFPMPYTTIGDIPIAHLWIDASALALTIASTPSTPCVEAMRTLGGWLRNLHVNVGRYDGRSAMGESGVTVSETGGVRLLEACVNVRTPAGGTQIVLKGETLSFPVNLPDTVRAALVGRPLRDFAPLHPMLDSRRIASTRQGALTLEIVLERRRVPVADHIGLTVGEASAALGRLVGHA